MKKIFSLFAAVIMAVSVMADDIVLNCTNLGLTSTSYNTSWSKTYGGVTFNSNNIAKNSNGIAIKSKGAMWNSTATSGNITSISFSKLSFSSTSGASVTIYGGSSAAAKTEELKTITSGGATSVSFSGKSYQYFYIDNAGTRALYFECTVSYTTGESVAYKVTFDAGDGECEITELTEANAGAGVTLPDCTAPTDYSFVGWSKAEGSANADAGEAGDTYYPKSNHTVYAVYHYDLANEVVFDLSENQYGWDATSDGTVYFDGSTYTPAVEGDITMSVFGNVRMWGETNSSLRLYGASAGKEPDPVYTYGKGSVTLSAPAGYTITAITFEGSNLTFSCEEGTYTNPTWSGSASSVTLEKGSNTPQIKKVTVTYTAPKKYTVNFSSNWASFCAAEKVAIPATVVAYKGAVNDDVLTLTPVVGNVIPAGVGVMLKSTESTATLTVSDETAADFSGNQLLGTTADTEAPANAYCYSKSQNTFAPVAMGFSIPANKAYLVLASAPERISIVEADHNFVTELVNVESKAEVKKMVINGKMMILRDGKTFDVMGRIVK